MEEKILSSIEKNNKLLKSDNLKLSQKMIIFDNNLLLFNIYQMLGGIYEEENNNFIN